MGQVYVFKQNDYYMTILPLRYGFLWRSPFVCSTESINHRKDKIRTIGTMSYTSKNGSITLLIVDVKDKNVVYIEAGPKKNIVRQMVTNNNYIDFVWDKVMHYYDANPIAITLEYCGNINIV